MCKPFQFKQFTVNQDQCAMKIGTDAVLLGAWTSLESHPFSILDIGAGTGILSLMLAQRSQAQIIEAVEIDALSYEQCVDNFEQSPWNDRLFCYYASIQEFSEEIDDNYDLIICNPPFYSEDYKTNSKQRDLARFQDAMPFTNLIEATASLLSDDGIFSIIIPCSEEQNFLAQAKNAGLFPKRITRVKGHPAASAKRSLIELSFKTTSAIVSELVIETSRHQYTDAYIQLTQDFYLKM